MFKTALGSSGVELAALGSAGAVWNLGDPLRIEATLLRANEGKG